MFVEPGGYVYEGMIVRREPARRDLDVNACEESTHVSNMRSST